MLTLANYKKVGVRATISEVHPFPKARRPAYRLVMNCDPELVLKQASFQLMHHCSAEVLAGRQVLAVVIFPPKQIGPTRSEVLVLGVPDEQGRTVRTALAGAVPNGVRLY